MIASLSNQSKCSKHCGDRKQGSEVVRDILSIDRHRIGRLHGCVKYHNLGDAERGFGFSRPTAHVIASLAPLAGPDRLAQGNDGLGIQRWGTTAMPPPDARLVASVTENEKRLIEQAFAAIGDHGDQDYELHQSDIAQGLQNTTPAFSETREATWRTPWLGARI